MRRITPTLRQLFPRPPRKLASLAVLPPSQPLLQYKISRQRYRARQLLTWLRLWTRINDEPRSPKKSISEVFVDNSSNARRRHRKVVAKAQFDDREASIWLLLLGNSRGLVNSSLVDESLRIYRSYRFSSVSLSLSR